MSKQITISPVDSTPYVTRTLATTEEVNAVIERSNLAFQSWKRVTVKERVQIMTKFVDAFVAKKENVTMELTLQMGRPIKYTPNEINGTEERARYMISIAEESLKDVELTDSDKPGFKRFIRKEPLGPVLIISAWNYPYLISINGVVPALLAGNTVILKQSSQTPLCAERFAEAFKEAGLPENVFQILHMSHSDTENAIKNPFIAFVNFTGSVEGGREIQKAASTKFIATGLELGGKDPAYVRHDVDIDYAVEQLVDGSFFNSGQCCCAIERIYVHEKVYDQFVQKFVELTKQYKLGDPLDPETTLGPMVRTKAAEFVRKQIEEAVNQGAKPLIDTALFPQDKNNTPYMAPQILVNVNHSMRVMTEESFGPVIGIMKVSSDEEAIQLMNDSEFGLTASIWTKDPDAAVAIGSEIDTGTWFMNRCDYLDPALAWVGVKNSGRGCTLSKFGFDYLTRPKSFHLKLVTK
ncbi:aldehyde dehydrogenase [Glomus cerebriforme]|uniref:Aldehyde dehydrogenase n=1 Tax=Glomus cerebriforme TaxID=658196 RepID=A0A397T7Q8_9GLOM|nr:aldehyde dehydrogenase [Glomus cerebriforme]